MLFIYTTLNRIHFIIVRGKTDLYVELKMRTKENKKSKRRSIVFETSSYEDMNTLAHTVRLQVDVLRILLH